MLYDVEIHPNEEIDYEVNIHPYVDIHPEFGIPYTPSMICTPNSTCILAMIMSHMVSTDTKLY